MAVCALHFEAIRTLRHFYDGVVNAVCALHFEAIHTVPHCAPTGRRAVCALHFEAIHTTWTYTYCVRLLTSREALTEWRRPRLDAAQPARIFLFSFYFVFSD